MPASPRHRTCTAIYPGDMYRYADRLESAAQEARKSRC